ncbi:MAG: 30S ribosomal protein S20 [Erysipelotrichia bacterium]|nr:30S ribosomal protein S20 [Erysipelotrichia bacterium]
MTTGEVFSKLLGCSVSGYFNWKKQKRSIVVFLEKCFSKEELETYVLTGEIPAKIEFANRMYVGMELKMAYFLTNTVKNKLHLLILFTYASLEDAPKKALELSQGEDKEALNLAVSKVYQLCDKAVVKGILHKNTAARKINIPLSASSPEKTRVMLINPQIRLRIVIKLGIFSLIFMIRFSNVYKFTRKPGWFTLRGRKINSFAQTLYLISTPRQVNIVINRIK